MLRGIGICRLTAAFGTAFALLLVFSLTVRSQEDLKVGYAVITASDKSPLPVATALFSYRNQEGILVSEAGVGAVTLISEGRIFVEAGAIRTGVALANPSSHPIAVQLILRDNAGQEYARKPLSLPAGEHRARFVDEAALFGQLPEGFTGSLTFRTGAPSDRVAAVTIRQALNAYDEPLLATLPVVELADTETQETVFPHLGAGGILTTQLILINPTSQLIRGEIALTGPSGLPLELELDGDSASTFSFELEPNGVFRGTLTSASGVFQGYAVVRVEETDPVPAGTALFQYRNQEGELISEAGVGAVAATKKSRIFVDTVGTQTGVAVANAGNREQEVTFRLLDRNGLSMGETSETLASNGQLAIFAEELFEDLPPGFTGVMEIESEEPVRPVTLKLTTNGRRDLILTTLPVADLSRPRQSSSVVFPQIGFGLGFSTRLIFISTDEQSRLRGDIRFLNSNGTEMVVPVLGRPVSDVAYTVEAGGALQVRPGNEATVAGVQLDPSALFSTEVVVNQGNTVVVRPLVVDTSGEVRDDFPLTFLSIDPETASVDELGRVTGHQAGFSTLTLAAGSAISTGTVTVVEVLSGVEGFEIIGIAQDTAGRLYLADARDHAILLSQSLQGSPEVYAGVDGNPGFRNDRRLNSLFSRPSFLALNQADTSLYVSDSENHVIRRVVPGPEGWVETVAGTGEVGDQDGSVDLATFNDPQGVALDHRGHLWVVDSGNHIIRRINLVDGSVQTLAGQPGVAGLKDGVGSQALFNSPGGLAIETEPLAQRLERETRGDPPPAVSVIVADTGNGVLRRVKEDGEVTAVGSQNQGLASETAFLSPPAAHATTFQDPAAVAVDPFGNIYVAESATNQVRIILSNGDVVRAAGAGTFTAPRGMAITDSGKVIVAGSGVAATEIVYGQSQILTVSPESVDTLGGQQVAIKGKNFAPESVVIIGGLVIDTAQVLNTETVVFTSPAVNSGLTTLTIQNRSGAAQVSFRVEPVPFEDLPPGYIATVAGGGTYMGDGAAAAEAYLDLPDRVTVNAAGDLLVADTYNHRIRRIDATTGVITTVAGNGLADFSGNGGLATAASLDHPLDIAVDPRGNLFIADLLNNRIRKVDAATGIITTVAGNGMGIYGGDGGPATKASFRFCGGLAVDASGNLFLADSYSARIRKVDATTGIITTVAGNGTEGFSGDGGPATDASLNFPQGIAVDREGNLFIADSNNHRIRRLDAGSQAITSVAGNGQPAYAGDDGPATNASLNLPGKVEVDSTGNLFIVDTFNHRIREVEATTGTITTVAGNGSEGFGGDGGPATAAALSYPDGVAVDASGSVFIADTYNDRVRLVDPATGIIVTVSGGRVRSLGDGGPATSAILDRPGEVAVDRQGNLFIADAANDRIRKVDAGTGMITTVAGSGEMGFSGDGGPANAAALLNPDGVAVDSLGNLFIADTFNDRIRRVDAATDTITTVAGNGQRGFSGDGGPATATSFYFPGKVEIDAAGNLLIVDTFNHRIREVDATTGRIRTVAGNGGVGYFGDGGPATAATLFMPRSVALGPSGNLFIADSWNHCVRKVDAATGIISSVGRCRSGMGGYCCEDVEVIFALFNLPQGVAVDAEGNLFIADTRNYRVRRVDAATGIITTVAGNGQMGFSGDGGPATAASLNDPQSVAVDAEGNLFIVDTGSHRIWAVRGPFN